MVVKILHRYCIFPCGPRVPGHLSASCSILAFMSPPIINLYSFGTLAGAASSCYKTLFSFLYRTRTYNFPQRSTHKILHSTQAISLPISNSFFLTQLCYPQILRNHLFYRNLEDYSLLMKHVRVSKGAN